MAYAHRPRPARRAASLVLALWIALLVPLAQALGRAPERVPCGRAAGAVEPADRACCAAPAPSAGGCCCSGPRAEARTPIGATTPVCATGSTCAAEPGVEDGHACDCRVEPGEAAAVVLLPSTAEAPGVEPPPMTGRVGAAALGRATARGARALPEPQARSGPDLVERHRTYRI